MAELSYVHLDVFTAERLSGNQLAVFLDPSGLDAGTMQRIANEMAFPETTFVLPAELPGTDVRVRIFTPRRELPMAGHPTIGTTFALADAGKIGRGTERVVLGLGVGPTPVRLEWGPGGLQFAWMTQSLPTLGTIVEDRGAVAAALGLTLGELAGAQLPVQVASSGVEFLYVPLTSWQAVDAAVLDRGALATLLRAAGLVELPVFVFSTRTPDPAATVYSRMFAPVFGITEDPATGGACGPLAAYLLQHQAVSTDRRSPLLNLQGVSMGRPSRIYMSARTRAGVLDEVAVGGEAVIVGRGTLCS